MLIFPQWVCSVLEEGDLEHFHSDTTSARGLGSCPKYRVWGKDVTHQIPSIAGDWWGWKRPCSVYRAYRFSFHSAGHRGIKEEDWNANLFHKYTLPSLIYGMQRGRTEAVLLSPCFLISALKITLAPSQNWP